METKICSICKEEKEYKEFYKDKRKKDGLYSSCKRCHQKLYGYSGEYNPIYQNQYRKEHKEQLRNYFRKYKRKDKDYYKKWCNNNRSKVKRYHEEYYKLNNNNFKRKTRNKTNNLINCKIILKVNKCSQCNSTKNIEKHHSDYNDAENIVWLCRKCHRELHRK